MNDKQFVVFTRHEYEKMYGIWPFTVSGITVKREGYALYLLADGVKYNLNGVAKEGRSLDEIWIDNEEIPGSKISINFIISMCNRILF